MTDKPWKLVLLLTGIFLAGGVAGGFVTIRVIHKPGIGHHPHGLDDPTPVVDFILKYAVIK